MNIRRAAIVVLLVTLFLTIALFNAPMTDADANQLTFSSGLTLYSPINTTYDSHVVLCNGTFGCPKGWQCSLNYSIDGEYQDGLLWSLNPGSIIDPYIFVVNGSFPLPQLPNGSHRLSIGIDEELYSGGAIINRTSWVNTAYFTINSNQPMTSPNIPELSPLALLPLFILMIFIAAQRYILRFSNRGCFNLDLRIASLYHVCLIHRNSQAEFCWRFGGWLMKYGVRGDCGDKKHYYY
jgi:hypothetical protein